MDSARDRRELTSTALVWLTFVLALVAGPITYAAEIADDEDRFVAVADRALEHPVVREAVAEQITEVTFGALDADEAVADILPDSVRSFAVPLTRTASRAAAAAAFSVLETEAAEQARDTALREVHRQIAADGDGLVIDLRAVMVRTAREIGGPAVGTGVANFVSGNDAGRFTLIEPGSANASLVGLIHGLPGIGLATGLATVIALAIAVVVARDRRRALVRSGLALAMGALLAVIVVGAFLDATSVLSNTPLGADIGRGLSEAITSDFAAQQRGGIVGGLVIALLGLLLGERPAAIALRRLPRLLWARDREGSAGALSQLISDNPAMARILVWMGGAVILAGWPAPTTRVMLTVIVATVFGEAAIWIMSAQHPSARGVRSALGAPDPSFGTDVSAERSGVLRTNLAFVIVVLFLVWPGWDKALVESFFVLLALIVSAVDIGPARRSARARTTTEDVARTTTSRRGVRLGVAVVTVVLVAGVVALSVRSGDTVVAGVTCNGAIELCDRSVDEIVWAGSHNSMASTDLGWELAMQTGDITAQLDHGVRALLIDTKYWQDDGTVEVGDDPIAAEVIEQALASEIEPQPGTWLCHGFCALGATEFAGELTAIDVWLDEHPRDVLMLVIQDEISTEDTFEAFEASGLIDRVHDHRPGTPWPTLGELIEADERVLVYAENEGTPDSWYQNAWEETFTDSPFKFALRSEFECGDGRGDAANPLFLLNHWLTTGVPVVEVAAAVNSRTELSERVEDCRVERGRLPTVIAVDFVETGDLVEYVAELNGAAASDD